MKYAVLIYEKYFENIIKVGISKRNWLVQKVGLKVFFFKVSRVLYSRRYRGMRDEDNLQARYRVIVFSKGFPRKNLHDFVETLMVGVFA